MIKKSLLFLIIWMYAFHTFAQFGKITFNGLGRSYINASELSGNITKNDTTTANKTNTGVTILDLNFDIKPNKTTEIVALARVADKFGGFWGNGLTLNFRQLYARGIIANAVRYRVGDIYVENSPYTTFNPMVEESYNQAELFNMYKDYLYYDNFHVKDRWHMQGADVDFGISFKKYIHELLFDGYIGQNNPITTVTTPETLYQGAKITLNQSKYFDLVYHYAELYQMTTANQKTEFHNPVQTVEMKINFGNEKIKQRFSGEFGESQYKVKNDTLFHGLKDNFFDVGYSVEFVPSKLTFKVSYREVGPDFRSAGAQSKRLDFDNQPQLFTQYTNAQTFRPITMFDITKDEALYASSITSTLMTYNPKYANVMPYGVATPNRQGVNFKADYTAPEKLFNVFADCNFLQEIKGQGTTDLRKFNSIGGGLTLNLNEWFDLKRIFKITTGIKYESTQRAGEPYSSVNLKSNLIDAGLEYEFVKDFDFLVGAKFLTAKGNEFTPVRDNYTQITDFTAIPNINDKEVLLGGGIRYRFSENIFLTLHYMNFGYTDKTDSGLNYNINQFVILYTMKF